MTTKAPALPIGKAGVRWTRPLAVGILGLVTPRNFLRLGLFAWFAFMDYRIVTEIVLPFDAFGGDGLMYSRAAAAWLSGGDPWDVTVNGTVYIAAPPPTLVPFALTAWMPDNAARVTWVVVGFLAIVLTVRRLRLPLWCLLFPPSIFSALHGSIETVMVLFLVVGPKPLAPFLKVYAAIPMVLLGQWRSLSIAAVLVVVTAPFLPWGYFIAHLGDITPRLTAQTNGGYSAFGDPLLLAATIVALLLLDRRVAAFAIVPAIWPNAAPQYGAMLLPVIHRLPLVAIVGVLPFAPHGVSIGVVGSAIGRVVRRHVPRRMKFAADDLPLVAAPAVRAPPEF